MSNRIEEGNGHDLSPYAGFVDPISINQLTVAVENATRTMTREGARGQSPDVRRDLDDECGFPKDLTIQHFKDMYDRNPIATRVVQVLPRESWKSVPQIIEDEDPDTTTPFEEAFENLAKDLRGQSWFKGDEGNPIWEHLRRADELCGIGSYGVLLLGIDDGLPLSQPAKEVVEKGSKPVDAGKQGEFVPPKDLTAEPYSLIGNLAWNAKPNPFAKKKDEEESPPEENPFAKGEPEETEDGEEAEEPEEAEEGDTEVEGAEEDGVAEGEGEAGDSGNLEDGGSDENELPGESLGDLLEEGFPGEPEPVAPPRKLLYLRAFDESLVAVSGYESNPASPRYGQPTMYSVTLNDSDAADGKNAGAPLATQMVHWTRIIHLADNLTSSELFGVPRQKPCFNNLYSLRKLMDGGPEAYWKACIGILSFETHPQLGGDVNVDLSALRDMVENLQNGLQRFITTTGMTAKTLSPGVTDPSTQVAGQMEAICILIGVPKRIFMGSERGELSSKQDEGTWESRCQDRQNNFITPRLIVPFVDRLIVLGVLPEPVDSYDIIWPDIAAMSDADKAALASQRTEAFVKYISGGVENLIPPMQYLTVVHDMPEDQARSILEAAEEFLLGKAAAEPGMEGVPPGMEQPAIEEQVSPGAEGGLPGEEVPPGEEGGLPGEPDPDAPDPNEPGDLPGEPEGEAAPEAKEGEEAAPTEPEEEGEEEEESEEAAPKELEDVEEDLDDDKPLTPEPEPDGDELEEDDEALFDPDDEEEEDGGTEGTEEDAVDPDALEEGAEEEDEEKKGKKKPRPLGNVENYSAGQSRDGQGRFGSGGSGGGAKLSPDTGGGSGGEAPSTKPITGLAKTGGGAGAKLQPGTQVKFKEGWEDAGKTATVESIISMRYKNEQVTYRMKIDGLKGGLAKTTRTAETLMRGAELVENFSAGQPRDSQGRFGSGGGGGGTLAPDKGGSFGGTGTMTRSERAKTSHKPSTGKKQRLGESEQNRLAKVLGGQDTEELKHNAPFDVEFDEHLVEVKMVINNENNKLTVHPKSKRRKIADAKEKGKMMHMIAIDKRSNNRKYYYKEGVGSYRISAMDRVSVAQLKQIFREKPTRNELLVNRLVAHYQINNEE